MARKAEQLLNRMRQSPGGWRPHHFHTLYLGFGFIMMAKKKHDVFYHPEFPQLRDTIPRHAKELSKAYARDAVKNIEALIELQTAKEKEDDSNS